MNFSAAFDWFKPTPVTDTLDPYKVLGVSKWASDEEIKRVYRKLAMKHHPDFGGDALILQNLNIAYGSIRRKRGG